MHYSLILKLVQKEPSIHSVNKMINKLKYDMKQIKHLLLGYMLVYSKQGQIE